MSNVPCTTSTDGTAGANSSGTGSTADSSGITDTGGIAGTSCQDNGGLGKGPKAVRPLAAAAGRLDSRAFPQLGRDLLLLPGDGRDFFPGAYARAGCGKVLPHMNE